MSRLCAVCNAPASYIDTRWEPHTTITITGWHFDQHEPAHTYLCDTHHHGARVEPKPRMVAYHGDPGADPPAPTLPATEELLVERTFDTLTVENNGTGSRANDRPAPSARPLGGPTDER